MGMMPLGTVIYGILFDYVPAEYLFFSSSAILIAVTCICINKKVLAQYVEVKALPNTELKEQTV